MKKAISNLYRAILLLLGLLLMTPVYAQDKTVVTGLIKDGLGPLAGARVIVKESGKGTISNADGRYVLVFPSAKEATLIFSFIGKESKEITWKGQKIINVELEDATSELREVVVTARPNINELDVRDKTGTIAHADMGLVRGKPSSSLALSLQGTVPGLQVINRGELGQRPEIRVRGTSSLRRGDLPNEPLYVLDGQVISPETFFTLNPEDIKSIKILKDAVATALYGIKAANGVLEITSYRGFSGDRTISFSSKTGITFRGTQAPRMMGAREKLELERLLENPSAPGFLYSEKYIRKMYPFAPNIEELVRNGAAKIDSLAQINTDWHKKLIRPNMYNSYNLSLRGGDQTTSYYTSIGYMKQGGQIKGNDYSRLSGRLSLDHKFTTNTIVGLSTSASYGTNHTPNGSKYSLLDLVYRLNPYETEQSPELYSYPGRGYSDLFNQFSSTSTSKSIGLSANLISHPIEGLEVSVVEGFDFLLDESLSVTPASSFSEQKSGLPINERGQLRQDKNTVTNLTSNIRTTYQKTLGKHDFVLGANTDFYSTLYDNLYVSGRGIQGGVSSAAGIDNSIDGQSRARVGGRKELFRTIGAGVLAGYTYDNKYDIFGTYKVDASSVLPKDKRTNSAWALGGGCNLKRILGIEWIDQLKLRASYGYTANLQGVSAEHTIATFGYTEKGYNSIRGMKLMALPNENLRAEKNHMLDYGVKAKIYSTEVDLSVYKRTTKDALLEIPIPSSNGFITQWQNIGVLENKGVDLSLSQDLVNTGAWYSRVRVSLSYNKNRVVSLYGRKQLFLTPESIIPEYEEGEPTDVLFGLNALGINTVTGLPMFLTKDNEEKDIYYQFKRGDYIAMGHRTPPITGSIYWTFSYGNLEVDLNLYYTLLGIREYQYTYVRKNSDANLNAVKGQVEDMWIKPGDENKRYPSPFVLSLGYANLQRPSTHSYGSTDLLRLNSLGVRYKLEKKTLDKILFGAVRYITLGVEGSNLFTLTRFSESDPESGNLVAPLQPILAFSVNLTF